MQHPPQSVKQQLLVQTQTVLLQSPPTMSSRNSSLALVGDSLIVCSSAAVISCIGYRPSFYWRTSWLSKTILRGSTQITLGKLQTVNTGQGDLTRIREGETR